MGKYMRKGKVSGEVAVMEVAGALLGVRTRSRTLALQQRTQKGEDTPADAAAGAGDYLELRSRRLEKQPPPPPHREREASVARRAATGRKGEAVAAAVEEFEAEPEVSFGDNVLDWDAVERSTRETTPCSLIKSSETINTPGSATRTGNRTSSHRRMETPICRYIPSSLEMEEFFATAEQQQQQTFREKYNFCPANDCPLPGRYEWMRLDC